MAISDLKGIIDATIKTNGRQEITGASLNEVLTQIVDATDAELAELSQEKEDKTNKVTSLTEESTDEQYPSAKAVYALSERISENEILIEDLQNTKIDKEADDYYPQLAVGLADNLSGVDVVDSEVNFRRSGGGAISDGVARIEAIKGNSVVWNMQYKPSKSSLGTTTKNGITHTVSEDGTVKAEGTAEGASSILTILFRYPLQATHKYILIAFGVPAGEWGKQGLYFSDIEGLNTTSLIGKEGYKIFNPATDGFGSLVLTAWTGYSLSCEFRPIFCDLTQMFGAGNEPTTIEDFYSRIPMGVDLNAYNEGEVIHMDVQSIESVGVNQWDEEWEVGTYNPDTGELQNSTTIIRSMNFINVLPNAIYYIKTPASIGTKSNLRVYYYDNSNNYLGCSIWLRNDTSIIITPTNCAYITFVIAGTTSYDHDICINISDTSINGKYFPYIKRVEDLSIISKYFPQGMKSAGTAHDEIRYNKASGKWEYSKGKIKSVDLGTLNWKNLDASNGMFYISRQEVIDLNMATHDNENIPTNLISSLYASVPTYDIVNIDKVFRGPFTTKFSGYLTVKDTAYTDAASFKADLQGVMLYYESNDWEWVELDAEDQFRDLDYQVWNCGTEKAIAEGKSAPLAADITYGFNAIGKIKELESLVAQLRAKVGI